MVEGGLGSDGPTEAEIPDLEGFSWIPYFKRGVEEKAYDSR